MLETVVCYRSPTTTCNVDRIADWLTDRIEATVEVRDRFLDVYGDEELAERFAHARITSPYDRSTGTTMLGAVRYEQRVLDEPANAGGVLYDGLSLQRSLAATIPPAERELRTLHIAVLDRPIATWGDHDGRWHKRVVILGAPALVSVPGLYEAPAKPAAYYAAKHRYAMTAGDVPPREYLEATIDGDFLLENDHRTTEALKGYFLQAVHLRTTGSAFCHETDCRLANPHRQAGVIRAQLREPAFCSRHAARYEP